MNMEGNCQCWPSQLRPGHSPPCRCMHTKNQGCLWHPRQWFHKYPSSIVYFCGARDVWLQLIGPHWQLPSGFTRTLVQTEWKSSPLSIVFLTYFKYTASWTTNTLSLSSKLLAFEAESQRLSEVTASWSFKNSFSLSSPSFLFQILQSIVDVPTKCCYCFCLSLTEPKIPEGNV